MEFVDLNEYVSCDTKSFQEQKKGNVWEAKVMNLEICTEACTM
jgi:hypothetical protein